MALDPRLMSVELLTLAALRRRERSDRQADPFAVTWLRLEDAGKDPDDLAPSPSGIFLPKKCQTVEEWANSPLIQAMRAKLRQPGGEA